MPTTCFSGLPSLHPIEAGMHQPMVDQARSRCGPRLVNVKFWNKMACAWPAGPRTMHRGQGPSEAQQRIVNGHGSLVRGPGFLQHLPPLLLQVLKLPEVCTLPVILLFCLCLYSSHEVGEARFGIAQYSYIHGIILPDLPWVDIDLNEFRLGKVKRLSTDERLCRPLPKIGNPRQLIRSAFRVKFNPGNEAKEPYSRH